MLPAAHRIRTAADFRETTHRGARASRGCVVAYAAPSSLDRPARVGIITSSSIGGSVVRHRAARRIRAVVAGSVAQWPDGVRIVLRALPGADSDPSLAQHVLGAIESALAKSTRRHGAAGPPVGATT